MSIGSAILRAILALLAVVIGTAILSWVLYNELIEMQPAYERGPLLVAVSWPLMMIGIGAFWVRQALGRFRGSDDTKSPKRF